MKRLVFGILLFVATVLLHSFLPSFISLVGWEMSAQELSVLDKALDVLVWAGGTLLICLIIRIVVWRVIVKNTTKRNTPELIKQLLDFVVIIISIIFASKILFGQNVLAAVTALGALGIVISFGIKDLIQDLMTGLAVNLELSFALGDWVSVQDGQVGRISGQVVQINWRTTHILDENKKYFIVPNREIGNSTITVFSNPTPLTREEVIVEVDYEIPVKDAKRILTTAVMSVLDVRGFSQHPKPDVIVSSFPASGIEYKVRFWIYAWDQITPPNAKDAVLSSAMRHLRLNALSPSFPKLQQFNVDKPDMLKSPELAKNTPRFISNMSFFEPMTDEESDFVAERGKIVSWQKGELILKQGAEGDSMFIMLGGLVKAYVAGDDGRDIYVGQIQAGELFGEMSLLTGEPRSANVKAATHVTTLEISQEIFRQVLSNRPILGEKLSEIIAVRQQRSADLVARSGEDETQSLKVSIYGKMREIFKLP